MLQQSPQVSLIERGSSLRRTSANQSTSWHVPVLLHYFIVQIVLQAWHSGTDKVNLHPSTKVKLAAPGHSMLSDLQALLPQSP